MRYKKRYHILFLFVFICFQDVAFSQTKIFGTVKGAKEKLYSASIILKDSTNQSIIDYSYSDNHGNYVIHTHQSGKLYLEAVSLGYEKQIIPIDIAVVAETLEVDIVLKATSFELKEVVVKAEVPIRVKKDTISFKTKYYTNGTEQTVEDLLRTIPGVNVSAEGTIKVGNKEIEKLMIDGDDFFEKSYKLLSKNMPAYPIEEVEVLENYSNNHLLKGIEESDKVALNLNLKEEAKRVWFGNVEPNLGLESFYEFRANLMNFGKKSKYYFLSNLNNIGYETTEDIASLIRNDADKESNHLGEDQQLDDLIDLSASNLEFEKNRTNFNNAELVSLNTIFNPTEKLKIKALAFLNWDETDFFRNRETTIQLSAGGFTNREAYQLRRKKNLISGKLDITNNMSKTEMVNLVTKYGKGDFRNTAQLIFNDQTTLENLEQESSLFDQSLRYTNKFKKNQVLLFTGRFIEEKRPQDYRSNQFLFENLFPDFSNADGVQQQIENQMQFAGANLHWLRRQTNGNLLELNFGNEYRKDNLSSTFALLKDENILNQPNAYQNQMRYQLNDLYLKSKYHYKWNALSIIGKINFHQLSNFLNNEIDSEQQSLFFVNPSIGVDWRLNDRSKISSSYAYKTSSAKALDVFGNFIQTGFRSFSKGIGSFTQLAGSKLILNYQFGDWSDRFFANTFAFYSKNHDFLSTNALIEQNFSQIEKILIKDRAFFSVNSDLNYYFKSITSNLKLELSYSRNEFKNKLNDLGIRKITAHYYQYGTELRSAFEGIFNYHFGTKWTRNMIQSSVSNSFTNNISFLDLLFVFKDKFDLLLKSERYFFGNLDIDNTYYFLDLEARYKLVKNKLTIGLRGKNLLDTKEFRNFSISDVGVSTTENRLLPRFVLLTMEYRF